MEKAKPVKESENQTNYSIRNDYNKQNKPLHNGYSNHGRRASNSSEGSVDDKQHSTWQPPPYKSSTSYGKPIGFRSVKAPSVQTAVSKPDPTPSKNPR